MPSRIRVLIVEDRPDQATYLERACREAVDQPDMLVEVARDSAAGLDHLGREHFDLAVCDLAIPKDRNSMAPDHRHGMAVIEEILRAQPGLPIIVLSEHGDDPDLLRRFVREATQGDPYGLGADFPMIAPFPREELLECVRSIAESLRRSEGVASLPVLGPGAGGLDAAELRTIQIFARRSGGAAAHVALLDNGLSAAKALRVEVLNEDDAPVARVVAKIGPHRRVLRETTAFSSASMILPAGLGAPLSTTVDVGAGSRGAVFYRDLDDHDRDLFECLTDGSGHAVTVVAVLEARFKGIYEGATPKTYTTLDLRRHLVGGTDLAPAEGLGDQVRAVDAVEISGAECLQHGDLHGKNVLVDRRPVPMLIDYADVGRASGCTDPLTLELSSVFHPGAAAARGEWPTEVQAGQWFDLDSYAESCPFEDYVRACRAWLLRVAASDGEVAGMVLAYALRQLRYEPAIRPLALALLEAAAERLASVTAAA